MANHDLRERPDSPPPSPQLASPAALPNRSVLLYSSFRSSARGAGHRDKTPAPTQSGFKMHDARPVLKDFFEAEPHFKKFNRENVAIWEEKGENVFKLLALKLEFVAY